jgi:hypothetical protein
VSRVSLAAHVSRVGWGPVGPRTGSMFHGCSSSGVRPDGGLPAVPVTVPGDDGGRIRRPAGRIRPARRSRHPPRPGRAAAGTGTMEHRPGRRRDDGAPTRSGPGLDQGRPGTPGTPGTREARGTRVPPGQGSLEKSHHPCSIDPVVVPASAPARGGGRGGRGWCAGWGAREPSAGRAGPGTRRPTLSAAAAEAGGRGLHGACGPGGGAGAGAVRQAVPVDRPGTRDRAPNDGGGEQAYHR